MPFSLNGTQHNTLHDIMLCRDLGIVMLNVILLSVIMLNALAPEKTC
jgi:hypothetical protein